MAFEIELPDGRKQTFDQMPTPQDIQAFAQQPAEPFQFGGGSTQGSSGVTAEIPEATAQGPGGIGQFVVEEGPQIVGGIAGAARGAALGAPLGPAGALAGAGAGAFVGGGGAELIRQAGLSLLKTPDAPESASEAFSRAGSAGGAQAVGELAAGGLLYSGARLLKPFVRSVTPQAQRALDFIQPLMDQTKGKAKRVFAALRPAEATESRALDIVDNIAEASLIGGGRVRAQELSRDKVLMQWQDDLLHEFGDKMSASDVGELFVEAVKGRFSPSRELASTVFNTLAEDAAAAEVMVSTKAIKKGLANRIRAAKVSRSGGEIGEQFLRELAGLPDDVPFADAHAFRSKALRLTRKAARQGEESGALKAINGTFTDAMEKSLKGQAPDLLPTWKKARDIMRTGSERFDNSTVKQMAKLVEAKAAPQRVATTLFTKDNVQAIRRAREAVDDETWKTMQRWFTEAQLQQATARGADLPAGKALLGALRGKGQGAVGRQVFEATLGKETTKRLEQFAEALETVQARQAEGTGRMLIQLAQGGAAINAMRPGASARERQAAAVTLIGPAVLARMMTNPRAAKLLIKGARTDLTRTRATSLVSQLFAAAAEAEQDDLTDSAETLAFAIPHAEETPPEPEVTAQDAADALSGQMVGVQ